MRTGFAQLQKGAGLIEIMIAIALGLFLATGIFQIMSSSRQTYKTQSALAWLQADARFAIETMTEHLRLAGARSISLIDKAIAFPYATINRQPPAKWCPGCAPITFTLKAEQILFGSDDNKNKADAVLDGTDVIAVRYQGAERGTTRDCLGNEVEADAVAVDVYYVSTESELRCSTGIQDLALVDGVENLQILYGMADSFNPSNPQVSCYLDASSPGTGLGCVKLDFDQVVSVRLDLLLHTAGDEGRRLRTDNDTAIYSLGGEDVQVNDNIDRRLRRVFSTSVSLRNRLK